jgi:hypothetical protein
MGKPDGTDGNRFEYEFCGPIDSDYFSGLAMPQITWPNSPAATASPLSDLCTLVRIEPLSAIRAPKGSDPI